MAIRPIVGIVRKQLYFDLVVALGGGTAVAYGYWYGYYLPSVKKRRDFYVNLEKEMAAEREAS